MNILNLIKSYMFKGLTLKGIAKNMANDNPIFDNLFDMADNGNTQGVETFARNICKEMNIDYEKEYAKFKRDLNIN